MVTAAAQQPPPLQLLLVHVPTLQQLSAELAQSATPDVDSSA
jgi:hypothetical protein